MFNSIRNCTVVIACSSFVLLKTKQQQKASILVVLCARQWSSLSLSSSPQPQAQAHWCCSLPAGGLGAGLVLTLLTYVRTPERRPPASCHQGLISLPAVRQPGLAKFPVAHSVPQAVFGSRQAILILSLCQITYVKCPLPYMFL